jgi:surfactin synthase thioesterase subunit
MTQSLAASQAVAASIADLAGVLKPFTPDALANGLATLIGALLGAMLAYASQRVMQSRLEDRNALTSAHRLMFALLQQINM